LVKAKRGDWGQSVGDPVHEQRELPKPDILIARGRMSAFGGKADIVAKYRNVRF
jgi:hypothetical protein